MAYHAKSKKSVNSKTPPTKPAKTPSGTQKIKAIPKPMTNAMPEPKANKSEQGTGRKRGGTVGPANSAKGRRRNVGNKRY